MNLSERLPAMSVLVINGPNLNMLGQREPDIYGNVTLPDIEAKVRAHGRKLGLTVECFQSNSEGAIIDYIQEHQQRAAGIIINPGGLTHTSVPLRDCLTAVRVPKVEVHISNIHAREDFRSHTMTGAAANGVITGLGWHGYLLALDYLAALETKA
ncbi:MAG: type II 3-dehydroquinate dehydratase [Dehalococcoidia bacterium]